MPPTLEIIDHGARYEFATNEDDYDILQKSIALVYPIAADDLC